MAKRVERPVYDDELDAEVDTDEEARELIIEQCMTDISEILAGAYEDISEKVRTLVDDLRDE